MANNRISVLIDVTVDKANSALASFKSSIAGADGVVGKFKAGAASLGASLKANMVPAAAVAGAAAVKLGKDAVQAASDLSESTNAVEKAYGSVADAVLEIGENAAESFGLSKSAFNDAAVGFSAFVEKIAGPGGDVAATLEDLTTRTADFASVMNLEVADAATTFRAALSGEQEAIKRYGIDMSAAAVEAFALSTGLAASKDEMTESIKVQARYGLLMQETSKFAGDFADTSDGLANSTRVLDAKMTDLKATLGEEIVPLLEDAAWAADKVVSAFGALQVSSDAVDWSIFTGGLGAARELLGLVTGETEKYAAAVDFTTDAQRFAAVQQAKNIEILKSRASAEEEAATATAEAWQKWETQTQAAVDSALANYETMVAAAETWAAGIGTQLDNGAQSFYDMELTSKTTAAEFIADQNARSVAAANHEQKLRSIYQQIESTLVANGDMTDTEAAEFVGYLGEMGASGEQLVTDLENGTVPIEDAVGSWRVAAEVAGDGMIAGLDPVADGMSEKMKAADTKLQQDLLAMQWSAASRAYEIGGSIVSGVGSGITGGQGALNTKIRAMINSALQTARNAAETGSPSKLFRDEIGKPIADGVTAGIDAGSGGTAVAAADMVAGTESAAASQIGAPMPMPAVRGMPAAAATIPKAPGRDIVVHVHGAVDRATARRIGAMIREEEMGLR